MAAVDQDPGQMVQDGGHLQDVDGNNFAAINFVPTNIQKGFIRKTALIVLLQWAITTFVILLFVQVEVLQAYVRQYFLIFVYCPLGGALLAEAIVVSGPEGFRRTNPWNGILLGVISITNGIWIGSAFSILSAATPGMVVIALGITALLALIITLLALQTRIGIPLQMMFTFDPEDYILAATSIHRVIMFEFFIYMVDMLQLIC